MKRIILARVDNRLLHGQVGYVWAAMVGSCQMIIADDEVAKDHVQQTLMSMVSFIADSPIFFLTVKQAAKTLLEADENDRIFLVVRTPEIICQLYEMGVRIQALNIGNMHFSKGKYALSEKVYVDEQDMEHLRTLQSYGIHIYIQDVPGDPVIELEEVITDEK